MELNIIKGVKIRISVFRWISIGIFALGLLSVPFTGAGIRQDTSPIKDGYIVYEHELYDYTDQSLINPSDCQIKYEMKGSITEHVTVTNLGATLLFSREITWKMDSAYQEVQGEKYEPETYAIGYLMPDDRITNSVEFTDTYTTTFVEEVNIKTGKLVRAELPVQGAISVMQVARYDTQGKCDQMIYGTILSRIPIKTTGQHSTLYCENSTSVTPEDHTMWGVVSDFKTINGRECLAIVPWYPVNFTDEEYYDVASGLYLGKEYRRKADNFEMMWVVTVSEQTVIEEWKEGGFIPGFTTIPLLFSLSALLFITKRRKD